MILISQNRYLLIFLIFFVLTPLLIWASTHFTRQQGLTELAEETENDLMLFARKLEDYLTGYDRLAGSVATSRQVTALLRYPWDKQIVSAANSYLQALNEEVHASAIYVMDLDGNTLAASNWQAERTFVGNNYGFRYYFQRAVKGLIGRDVAVGTTSGVLGYYVARPVFDPQSDEISGVAVIKVTLDELGLLFSDLDLRLLVADRDGVIFLASEDPWRFKSLRPLTVTKIEKIRRFKRYAGASLTLWPMRDEQYWDGISKLVVLDDGKEYLTQATLLLSRGWEMHVFKPTLEVDEHAYFAVTASLLVSALLFLAALYMNQRYRYLQDLRAAAIHDFLTGLYTRRYMEDVANAHISRINRGQVNTVSVAMIDIDHFKQVNDKFGHRAGDQVLRAVGKAISSEIRRGDIPVRYGGEEFLVIINAHNECDAGHLVSRILERLKSLSFRGHIRKLKITASAGVAHYRKGESLEDLLQRADELLYKAKEDGRDRFYDDEYNTPEKP
ncbi:MAG: diguanylate cyclase [Candidatus Thiodiazotropha sp. (ex Monitilora ramsayi)]|nr:diguanylate cyclase [Candidatus Thiodiazotropha sp. (ex Monitilora ramsayi)]